MKEEKMRTTKMRGWIIIMVLMFCLIGACSWAVSHETTAEKEKMMKSDELKQRGKQLREAIAEEYTRLDDLKELKNRGGEVLI